ncbi:hypothetical protein MXD59_16550 [Frankia sp. Ag45/Mut15]|uniref:Uncharacterized protein n=1 Tax=Frankia umida TaxID=573489 RepID=A0ABT0K1F4_9ACTN|nr:hypothetical protein [Frankia umida]MCK9877359.1 hypothetical protein [Frankia umida]
MWWQRQRPGAPLDSEVVARLVADPRAVRRAARHGNTPKAVARRYGAAAIAQRVLQATGDIWIAPDGAPTPTAADVLDALAGQALVHLVALRAEVDAEARRAPLAEMADMSAALDALLAEHTTLEAIQAGLLAVAVRLGISRETLAETGTITDEVICAVGDRCWAVRLAGAA